jgi:hypothetical protein
MKNIIILIAVLVAGVYTTSAQSVQQVRAPQTPTVRPEVVFTSTKTGGAATDTVFSGVIALQGTLYSAVTTQAQDTLHRFVGYQLVTGDTCTYTISYQDCTPEGAPFNPGTWTTIGAALQYVPNRGNQLWASVGLSTHFVRFRLIRAQGATQSVAGSKYSLSLFRY